MRKNSELDVLIAPGTPADIREKLREELKKLLIENLPNTNLTLTADDITQLSDAHLVDLAINQLHGIEFLADDETKQKGKIIKIQDTPKEKKPKEENTK